MGKLEMKYVWKGLRRCWTKALFGVIGSGIGGVVGSMIGGVAADGWEQWLHGATEKEEDQIRKAVVCESMMILKMHGFVPSRMDGSTVRTKYRSMAQFVHPDRNEMIKPFMSKRQEELTADEKQKLTDANNEFIKIHHSCEVLEVFIKDREAGQVTPADLKAYDEMAANMSTKWHQIDVDCKAHAKMKQKELLDEIRKLPDQGYPSA